MLLKIPGNALENSRECFRRFRQMLKKTPWNVQEDSGECSRRLRWILWKVPGNTWEDSRESSRRLPEMLEKIPGNVIKESGEWLYVFIISRTRFRVNPHSIVAWMSRNSFAQNRREIWSLSDCNGTWTQFGWMVECSFTNYVIVGSSPVAVT